MRSLIFWRSAEVIQFQCSNADPVKVVCQLATNQNLAKTLSQKTEVLLKFFLNEVDNFGMLFFSNFVSIVAVDLVRKGLHLSRGRTNSSWILS